MPDVDPRVGFRLLELAAQHAPGDASLIRRCVDACGNGYRWPALINPSALKGTEGLVLPAGVLLTVLLCF